jgi:hypothetical protein
MYPDESLQAFIEPDPWWEPTESIEYGRGRLIKAFLPHVDQNPYIAIPIGRSEPAEHREATVKFVPLDIRQAIRYPNLPVAALPQFPAERWGVYRIKKRPALILGSGGSKIDNNLTAGKAKWQTNRTVIVAPYYGVDEGEKRSGFNPVFVDRIRRCEYPQFFWDKLPIVGSTVESILRLDHLQPVGRSQDSIEFMPYRLSAKALLLLEEWIDWIIKDDLAFGKEDEEPRLGDIREFLLEY